MPSSPPANLQCRIRGTAELRTWTPLVQFENLSLGSDGLGAEMEFVVPIPDHMGRGAVMLYAGDPAHPIPPLTNLAVYLTHPSTSYFNARLNDLMDRLLSPTIWQDDYCYVRIEVFFLPIDPGFPDFDRAEICASHYRGEKRKRGSITSSVNTITNMIQHNIVDPKAYTPVGLPGYVPQQAKKYRYESVAYYCKDPELSIGNGKLVAMMFDPIDTPAGGPALPLRVDDFGTAWDWERGLLFYVENLRCSEQMEVEEQSRTAWRSAMRLGLNWW